MRQEDLLTKVDSSNQTVSYTPQFIPSKSPTPLSPALEYGPVIHDLRKTVIVTTAIVIAELVLFFVVK